MNIDNDVNPDGDGAQGGTTSAQPAGKVEDAARDQMEKLSAGLKNVGGDTSNPVASNQQLGGFQSLRSVGAFS